MVILALHCGCQTEITSNEHECAPNGVLLLRGLATRAHTHVPKGIMITHPFLVWLSYNATINRRIRQVALCAKRTEWPLMGLKGNETHEQIQQFMTAGAHPEDAQWIESNFDSVWSAYETWAFGCWHDWLDDRREWKKPRV